MTSKLLIRQAWVAPAAMLLPFVAGLFTPGYNSISEHMSALSLIGGWPTMIMRTGACLSGLSIIAFAIGCLRSGGKKRGAFTALAAGLFGIAMIFNGIFPMGSPLHGLYGLAIFSVLVPAFYAAELSQNHAQTWFVPLCLLTSVLSLAYMWALLVGLDPPNFSGLTQRIATAISFGWFAIVALTID